MLDGSQDDAIGNCAIFSPNGVKPTASERRMCLERRCR